MTAPEIDKLQEADELMYAAANEIQRLRRALKPFAKMADEVDEWVKGTTNFAGQFDANDLRAARAALTDNTTNENADSH